MAKKTALIRVTAILTVELKKGININDVISDMDYEFISMTDGAKIVNTEITEDEIIAHK